MSKLKAIKVFLDTPPAQIVTAMEKARSAGVPVVIQERYNVQIGGAPLLCFVSGKGRRMKAQVLAEAKP